MKKTMLRFAASVALGAVAAAAHAQSVQACPGDLATLAKCYTGADANGARYWIAIPTAWNKTLVVHAHGGPRLSPITADSSVEDLERFAVTVKQGFAWAGSSYRRPGYGVRMAAEDTDNVRKIFVKAFGQPARTLLHGQSWGGNVAAKAIELYPLDPNGSRNYDGVVLTNGMLAGGTRNYLHRADLRAIYQYYCRNHPRPDEPQYPLWTGLPADSRLTNKELAARVNDCTGVALPAAQRSEQQKRNLANILAVVPVPERALVSHLNWATFLFRDLVQRVLGGRNPFSNAHVVYRGSDDDAALNRDVTRFDADADAVARLADDSDLQGTLAVPVITMHAIDDPIAMVEYEAAYAELVRGAGSEARLQQTFTRENEHSKLADAEYAALFASLMQWIDSGAKPAPADVAAACAKLTGAYAGGCHFDPAFKPAPLFSRVPARTGFKAPGKSAPALPASQKQP
jgi:alpha-beta hydrolase superfamily lysophospholipase